MRVKTRFAPSPTGMLHIGGVRTALINQLFARSQGGRYAVRIEDTDQKRSTPQAMQAIRSGLEWLDLLGDEDIVYQSQRVVRHQQAGQQLYREGKAYYCDCSAGQLAEQREKARREGKTRLYNRHCRERGLNAGVLRIKMPTEGETIIDDLVQGTVRMENDHLDDYILLRGDGSPTYMLSCVVDDGEMGITHVIRGDDHLVNAFRQYHLLQALGFPSPAYAHVGLLHGADGAKLSKRHGALGVEHYQQVGVVAEALCNYLIRLGWGQGEEIITRAQAARIFALSQVSKAPSRLDFARLEYFNAHYIRDWAAHQPAFLVDTLERYSGQILSRAEQQRLSLAMPGLSRRTTRLDQLWQAAQFYLEQPSWRDVDPGAQKQFCRQWPEGNFDQLIKEMEHWSFDSRERIRQQLEDYIAGQKIGFGQIGQPMRIALAGSMQAPEIQDILFVLGKSEAISRLNNARDWGIERRGRPDA